MTALVAAVTLRILTFNIQAGSHGLANVEAAIRAQRADVVLLQEVDVGTRRSRRTDQAARLGARLGMSHVFVPHFRYQGGEFGLALLSRHPVDEVRRWRLPKSTLSALSARVRTPAGPVRFVNVHLVAHDRRLWSPAAQRPLDERRLREAAEIVRRAAALPGPVVIAGDFNAASGSPPWRALARRFTDACDAAGRGWLKTWPRQAPLTRIDYVWLNGLMRARSCVVPDADASDHEPVLVEAQLAASP